MGLKVLSPFKDNGWSWRPVIVRNSVFQIIFTGTNSGGGSSHFKEGVSNPGEKGVSSHMSPLKCMIVQKKGCVCFIWIFNMLNELFFPGHSCTDFRFLAICIYLI